MDLACGNISAWAGVGRNQVKPAFWCVMNAFDRVRKQFKKWSCNGFIRFYGWDFVRIVQAQVRKWFFSWSIICMEKTRRAVWSARVCTFKIRRNDTRQNIATALARLVPVCVCTWVNCESGCGLYELKFGCWEFSAFMTQKLPMK